MILPFKMEYWILQNSETTSQIPVLKSFKMPWTYKSLKVRIGAAEAKTALNFGCCCLEHRWSDFSQLQTATLWKWKFASTKQLWLSILSGFTQTKPQSKASVHPNSSAKDREREKRKKERKRSSGHGTSATYKVCLWLPVIASTANRLIHWGFYEVAKKIYE